MAVGLVTGSRLTRQSDSRDETGEFMPRKYLFDDMFQQRYDDSILDEAPRGPGALYNRLPDYLRLALEIQRRRSEYDVIVTWGERLSLALMAVQRLARDNKPHVPMMYWFSKPSVRLPMKLFGKSIHALVTWSSVQRDYAIRELGISPGKAYLIKHFVDQKFWIPLAGPMDTICAVGSEMRDYSTLVAAMRGSGIPCFIASKEIRVNRGLWRQTITSGELATMSEGTVQVGGLTHQQLRDLYRRSRFVVVPLVPSDTDNGVTTVCEAMAMGKAVICTKTQGQVDVIQDGVTGIRVPARDPKALRAAILGLWNDPGRAERMGALGRQHILRHNTLDQFCESVRRSVLASLHGFAAASDGSLPEVPARIFAGQ